MTFGGHPPPEGGVRSHFGSNPSAVGLGYGGHCCLAAMVGGAGGSAVAVGDVWLTRALTCISAASLTGTALRVATYMAMVVVKAGFGRVAGDPCAEVASIGEQFKAVTGGQLRRIGDVVRVLRANVFLFLRAQF